MHLVTSSFNNVGALLIPRFKSQGRVGRGLLVAIQPMICSPSAFKRPDRRKHDTYDGQMQVDLFDAESDVVVVRGHEVRCELCH